MEIVEVSGADLDILLGILSRASDLSTYRIRFAIEGGIKVKVNEGMWTAPYGTVEKRQ